MDQQEDSELVARYRAGETGALDVLVQRYRRQLFSYILNMIGSPDEADEVFQEAWLKVIRKIDRYKHGNFFGWLVRITHNVVIDRIRRKKPVVSLDAESDGGGSLKDVLPDDGPAPHSSIQNRDAAEAIAKAVATLPPEQKEVFLLRTKAEMPFKTIAKIQGTSINTALARMQYALAKLRPGLQDCYSDLNRA
jgi:RNA polymerase sigma factor (sigma-70 family)